MGTAEREDSKPAEVALEVWEQQAGESGKAYTAFAHYRDAGITDRSLRGTGRALDYSPSTIANWSSRYSWVQRSRAFDAELEKQRLAVLRTDQIAASRRHAQTLQVQMVSLGKINEEVLRRMNSDEKFLQRLQDKTLIQLAIGAARATPRLVISERLALGLSSENVGGHDGGPIDGSGASDMSDAELDAFLMGAEAAAAVKADTT
jgi:hypothetical protein